MLVMYWFRDPESGLIEVSRLPCHDTCSWPHQKSSVGPIILRAWGCVGWGRMSQCRDNTFLYTHCAFSHVNGTCIFLPHFLLTTPGDTTTGSFYNHFDEGESVWLSWTTIVVSNRAGNAQVTSPFPFSLIILSWVSTPSSLNDI